MYEALEVEKTSKTSYVLQTLWRDLSSDYDIIGPYYTSEGGLKSKFLLACLYDAMRQFHQFNFKVVAVVCDGASANLTALCHRQGAYSSDPSQVDAQCTSVISEPLQRSGGVSAHLSISPGMPLYLCLFFDE